MDASSTARDSSSSTGTGASVNPLRDETCTSLGRDQAKSDGDRSPANDGSETLSGSNTSSDDTSSGKDNVFEAENDVDDVTANSKSLSNIEAAPVGGRDENCHESSEIAKVVSEANLERGKSTAKEEGKVGEGNDGQPFASHPTIASSSSPKSQIKLQKSQTDGSDHPTKSAYAAKEDVQNDDKHSSVPPASNRHEILTHEAEVVQRNSPGSTKLNSQSEQKESIIQESNPKASIKESNSSHQPDDVSRQQLKAGAEKWQVTSTSNSPLTQPLESGVTSTVPQSSMPSITDNKVPRSQLVETYSPIIQPFDTSLSDARERLRTALNQTRMLREAFSDRVYEKYRVLLRPVQSSVDEMIFHLKKDPRTAKSELLKQMKMIKDEKEIEKKEAQRLNAELAAANSTGETLALLGGLSGVENAEQLSWFSAGLSLVILPEEEVDEEALRSRGIEHRGPIDPDTGTRVGGISSAAAAAAGVMLDRVRKSAEIRHERKRKLQLLSGKETDFAELSSNDSNLTPMICSSSGLLNSANNNRMQYPSETSFKMTKQMPKNASRGNQLHAFNGTSKPYKSKSLPSSGNLLSLSPHAEVVGNGRTTTAAMAALILYGVGSNVSKNGSKSSSNQHRFRHPHPQSKAGRNISFGSGTSHSPKRSNDLSNSDYRSENSTFHTNHLFLPPLLPPFKRRKANPVETLPQKEAIQNGARNSVSAVLKQFVTALPSLKNGAESHDEADLSIVAKGNESYKNNVKARCFKRNITEIGLLRGIRKEQAGLNLPLSLQKFEDLSSLSNTRKSCIGDNARVTNTDSEEIEKVTDNMIDPHLSFSVLYALGLVKHSSASMNNKRLSMEEDNSITSNVFQPLKRTGCTFVHSKSEAMSPTGKNDISSTENDFLARPPVLVSTQTLSEQFTSKWFNASDRNPTETYMSSSADDSDGKADLKQSIAKNKNETNLGDNYDSRGATSESKTSLEVSKASYIPNLRGGGESNLNLNNSIKCNEKDGERRGLNEGSTIQSSNPSSTPIHPGIGSSSVDGHASPFLITSHGTHILSEPSATAQSLSPNGSNLSRHQQQLQSHHHQTNEMFQAAALWSEQNRNDLVGLHSQQNASILPPHITSGLDGAYALMAQASGRSNSAEPSLYSSSPSPTSNNGVAAALSAAARLQGHAHQQSLQRPLSGDRERFQHHNNSTAAAHQLHLAQSSLQHATAALHRASPHILHSSSDIDYFGNNIHHPQHPSGYNSIHPSDWATLGAASGLLTTHPSLATATMGLTSHQAAMVSLSVRERAARALLAREQQQQVAAAHVHAQVPVAHRNAAALARGNPGLSTLSPQQAAALLSSNAAGSNNTSSFNTPSSARFAQMGTHSSASVLVGPSGRPQQLGTLDLQSASDQTQDVGSLPSSLLHFDESNQRPASATNWPSNSNTTSATKRPASAESRLGSQKKLPNKATSKVSFDPPINKAMIQSSSALKSASVVIDDNKFSTIPSRLTDKHHLENSSSKAKNPTSAINSTQPKLSLEKIRKNYTKFPPDSNKSSPDQDSLFGDENSLMRSTTDAENKSSNVTKDQASQIKGGKINIKTEVDKVRNQIQSKSSLEVLRVMDKLPSIKEKEKSKARASESGSAVAVSSATCLQFFIPPIPNEITSDEADLILNGFFHKTVLNAQESAGRNLESVLTTKETKNHVYLLEYLIAVGVAVPIPKTLVANPLKERLNTPPCKNVISGLGSGIGSLAVPREVMGAAITTWLWANHRKSFERAFAKSGRIDVDPECKWLINAAVDLAAKALLAETADKTAFVSNAGKRSTGKPGKAISLSGKSYLDMNSPLSQHGNIAVRIAALTSLKLMQSFCINEEMDVVLPNLDNLISHLDEIRLCALRARSQERALLASLVSRRTRMTESFSHAYTSSMIRAGEALGYEDLCDIVQNESTMTSTLLPFDILSDSTGAWEDPCRPSCGFIRGLSSDELSRKAHARAHIQKSLKKLQDRHGIKGGTPNAGPYNDSQNLQGGSSGVSYSGYGTLPSPKLSPSLSRSSSGLKRKSSLGTSDTSGILSNSNSSATAALFNPNHYSSPFIWDNDHPENMPYGRHDFHERRLRSISDLRLTSIGGKVGSKRARTNSSSKEKVGKAQNGIEICSTQEIEWSRVASMFRPVSLGSTVDRSSSSSKSNPKSIHSHSAPAVVSGSTIFAPFCRKLEDSSLSEASDGDGSETEEEDISDETLVKNHQKVLDGMKEKLDAMMEIRQQYQDRARGRSSGTR